MKNKIKTIVALGAAASAVAAGYVIAKRCNVVPSHGEKSRVNEIVNKIAENTGTDIEKLDDLIIRKEARLLVKAILMLQIEDPSYDDISIDDLCDDISYLDGCSGEEVIQNFQTVYDMLTAENEYSTAADMFHELIEKMDATQARIVVSYIDNRLRDLKESGSDIFSEDDDFYVCPDTVEPFNCQKLCNAVKDTIASWKIGKQYY